MVGMLWKENGNQTMIDDNSRHMTIDNKSVTMAYIGMAGTVECIHEGVPLGNFRI